MASRCSDIPNDHNATVLEEMLPDRIAKGVRHKVGNTDHNATLAGISEDTDEWANAKVAERFKKPHADPIEDQEASQCPRISRFLWTKRSDRASPGSCPVR